jgi:hypothetical protein
MQQKLKLLALYAQYSVTVITDSRDKQGWRGYIAAVRVRGMNRPAKFR